MKHASVPSRLNVELGWQHEKGPPPHPAFQNKTLACLSIMRLVGHALIKRLEEDTYTATDSRWRLWSG
jgi:hypothetical protein